MSPAGGYLTSAAPAYLTPDRQDVLVTTATEVPASVELDGDEVDAEDAWHLIRRHGVWPLMKQSCGSASATAGRSS